LHLQYIYIRAKEKFGLEPDDVFDNEEIQIQLFTEHRVRADSHLVCHNCYGGYFIPIEFGKIKFPVWEVYIDLCDVMFSQSMLFSIGSSIALRKELEEIALYLNFDLNKYFIPNSILYNEKIVKILNEHELFEYSETVALEIFGYEKSLLLQLYNVVLASIKYDLMISLSG
jgi:hypothetical protein